MRCKVQVSMEILQKHERHSLRTNGAKLPLRQTARAVPPAALLSESYQSRRHPCRRPLDAACSPLALFCTTHETLAHLKFDHRQNALCKAGTSAQAHRPYARAPGATWAAARSTLHQRADRSGADHFARGRPALTGSEARLAKLSG